MTLMPELEGVIERIVFQNEESGFTVARLQVENDLVTVVGLLSGLHPGEEVKFNGNWDLHPLTAGSSRWKATKCCRR